jgi:hypothetical protein
MRELCRWPAEWVISVRQNDADYKLVRATSFVLCFDQTSMIIHLSTVKNVETVNAEKKLCGNQ